MRSIVVLLAVLGAARAELSPAERCDPAAPVGADACWCPLGTQKRCVSADCGDARVECAACDEDDSGRSYGARPESGLSYGTRSEWAPVCWRLCYAGHVHPDLEPAAAAVAWAFEGWAPGGLVARNSARPYPTATACAPYAAGACGATAPGCPRLRSTRAAAFSPNPSFLEAALELGPLYGGSLGVTVSVWFKFSELSQKNANFLWWGEPAADAVSSVWSIGRLPTSERAALLYWVRDPAGSARLAVATTFGEWHHTVHSLDANGTWTVALDGAVVCDACQARALVLPMTTVRVGGGLAGGIDDVRVFGGRVAHVDVYARCANSRSALVLSGAWRARAGACGRVRARNSRSALVLSGAWRARRARRARNSRSALVLSGAGRGGRGGRETRAPRSF